jgi:hypothetical protein
MTRDNFKGIVKQKFHRIRTTDGCGNAVKEGSMEVTIGGGGGGARTGLSVLYISNYKTLFINLLV